MNWIYLLSGALAFILLIYLFAALLMPEIFE
jgi:K+-transporting ATPase KdpF subunit